MIPGDAPLGEPIESLRFAAVVVLLHEGEHCSAQGATDPRLVLIERSSRLRAHAGQLAFPGGKPEPQDGGELWTTAHREAHEEVGLHAPHRGAPSGQKLELLGRLDTVPTPTGFEIVPYVARFSGQWEPVVASGEVSRVLTPRVSELTAPGVHAAGLVRSWQGRRWRMHEFDIGTPKLWGASARIAAELLVRAGMLEEL